VTAAVTPTAITDGIASKRTHEHLGRDDLRRREGSDAQLAQPAGGRSCETEMPTDSTPTMAP
jgi:hypothetical protein